jgi:hypothetical protein
MQSFYLRVVSLSTTYQEQFSTVIGLLPGFDLLLWAEYNRTTTVFRSIGGHLRNSAKQYDSYEIRKPQEVTD